MRKHLVYFRENLKGICCQFRVYRLKSSNFTTAISSDASRFVSISIKFCFVFYFYFQMGLAFPKTAPSTRSVSGSEELQAFENVFRFETVIDLIDDRSGDFLMLRIEGGSAADELKNWECDVGDFHVFNFFLIIECKISKFYMNDNQWPVENALEFLGQMRKSLIIQQLTLL